MSEFSISQLCVGDRRLRRHVMPCCAALARPIPTPHDPQNPCQKIGYATCEWSKTHQRRWRRFLVHRTRTGQSLQPTFTRVVSDAEANKKTVFILIEPPLVPSSHPTTSLSDLLFPHTWPSLWYGSDRSRQNRSQPDIESNWLDNLTHDAIRCTLDQPMKVYST
jgi:hypothetical protein